jgi:hypothetical protein
MILLKTPTIALHEADTDGYAELDSSHTLYSTEYLRHQQSLLLLLKQIYPYIELDAAPFILADITQKCTYPVWDDTCDMLCIVCGV